MTDKHDPSAMMCGCLACWKADVADEEQREKKRENAVIAEAAAIIKKRKNPNSFAPCPYPHDANSDCPDR